MLKYTKQCNTLGKPDCVVSNPDAHILHTRAFFVHCDIKVWYNSIGVSKTFPALIIVRLEDNKGKEAQCNVLEEVLKYIYMISIV